MTEFFGADLLQNVITVIQSVGYPGAFASGLLGSSSLFIAVYPHYIVLPYLATVLNPLYVGILGGLGAAVGQFLHYYVGLGGRKLLPQNKRFNLDKWSERLAKYLNRYGMLVIFLFAVTPATPDDLVWIPLGMMRYPKWRALVAAIAGKVILNLAYAYFGGAGINFVLSLIGLGTAANGP